MITGFYAGLLTFLAVGLAFRVIGIRRRLLVGLGDGGDPALPFAGRFAPTAIASNMVRWASFSCC